MRPTRSRIAACSSATSREPGRARPAELALVGAGAAPGLPGLEVVGALPAVLHAEHRARVLEPAVERREPVRPAPLVGVERVAQPVVVAIDLAAGRLRPGRGRGRRRRSARRGSRWMSSSVSPVAIHSAIVLPIPPAPPKPFSESPAAIQNPRMPGIGPSRGLPSGVIASGWQTSVTTSASSRNGNRRAAPAMSCAKRPWSGGSERAAVIPRDAVDPAGYRVGLVAAEEDARRPPSFPYTRLSGSRKHGMSRGSSWPSTAFSATCWWSTGIDGVNAPTIAATCGAQIPPAFTTTSVSIRPRSRHRRRDLAPRPELDTGDARAGPDLDAESAGGRRPGRRWRCAGRGSRRRPPRPRRTALRRWPRASARGPRSGRGASTSRPIPRARLAPRRSSISCSPLEAIRRLPTGSNTPSSLVQLDAVAAEAHHRRRGVELGDEAGRVARRAARQLALLEEQDVGPPGLGQVVGDAAPGDAAADDNDSGSVTLHVRALLDQPSRPRRSR